MTNTMEARIKTITTAAAMLDSAGYSVLDQYASNLYAYQEEGNDEALMSLLKSLVNDLEYAESEIQWFSQNKQREFKALLATWDTPSIEK